MALPPMTLGEEIVADYTALRLTLRAHPMALVRPYLAPGRAGGGAGSTAGRRSG